MGIPFPELARIFSPEKRKFILPIILILGYMAYFYEYSQISGIADSTACGGEEGYAGFSGIGDRVAVASAIKLFYTALVNPPPCEFSDTPLCLMISKQTYDCLKNAGGEAGSAQMRDFLLSEDGGYGRTDGIGWVLHTSMMVVLLFIEGYAISGFVLLVADVGVKNAKKKLGISRYHALALLLAIMTAILLMHTSGDIWFINLLAIFVFFKFWEYVIDKGMRIFRISA